MTTWTGILAKRFRRLLNRLTRAGTVLALDTEDLLNERHLGYLRGLDNKATVRANRVQRYISKAIDETTHSIITLPPPAAQRLRFLRAYVNGETHLLDRRAQDWASETIESIERELNPFRFLTPLTDKAAPERTMLDDEARLLHDALSELSVRQAHVLQLLFFEEKTLEQVGRAIGVCRERVRQIERDALCALQKIYKRRGLAPVDWHGEPPPLPVPTPPAMSQSQIRSFLVKKSKKKIRSTVVAKRHRKGPPRSPPKTSQVQRAARAKRRDRIAQQCKRIENGQRLDNPSIAALAHVEALLKTPIEQDVFNPLNHVEKLLEAPVDNSFLDESRYVGDGLDGRVFEATDPGEQTQVTHGARLYRTATHTQICHESCPASPTLDTHEVT